MAKFQAFLSILSLLIFTGCASTPQTRAILESNRSLPQSHEIKGVPFVAQTEAFCGPASLSMVSSYWGDPASVSELAAIMFTPGKKGSLQTDYLGAARRKGFIAVVVNELRQVLDEIRHDHPVILFQNLGTSANPIFHYSVLIGFDLNHEEAHLRSGLDADLRMSLTQLERSWTKAGNWALVLTKAPKLPATVPLSELILAANALEKVEMNLEARAAYVVILERDASLVAAYFGLANASAMTDHWDEAAIALRKASILAPDSYPVWHNLAEVYDHLKQTGRASRARKIAEKLKNGLPTK